MGKSEISERRALSARKALWQLRARGDSAEPMSTTAKCLTALSLLMLGAPAFAVPGGQIDTLNLGHYACEGPGDAAGPTGERKPELDFAVVNGSSYTIEGGGKGSYLLTGDIAVMTSGPRKGERYRRLSRGYLRRIGSDGKDTDLRCVLAGRNNSAPADILPF